MFKVSKMAPLFLCGLIFLMTGSFASAQCSSDDVQIVKSIYGAMAKDKALASQIRHVNVTSSSFVVKLRGWVNKRVDRDRLTTIALKTTCVSMVNSQYLADTPPADGVNQRLAGCAAGMKPCGDICIPDTESCNIELFIGALPSAIGFESFAVAGPPPVCDVAGSHIF